MQFNNFFRKFRCESCGRVRKTYPVPMADTMENLRMGVKEYEVRLCKNCIQSLKDKEDKCI